jgi:hypothetical protein
MTPLGAGGMGEVYLARDTRLGRSDIKMNARLELKRSAGKICEERKGPRRSAKAPGLRQGRLLNRIESAMADAF